jgi:quinol monooxygenase YgiN
MIYATVTIAALADQRQQVVQVLRSLVCPTRVEAGCLRCELHENLETPGTFTFVEEWATLAHFERHLRSELYRRLLIVMELAVEPPDVRFRVVTDCMSMEAIHAVRQGRSLAGGSDHPELVPRIRSGVFGPGR